MSQTNPATHHTILTVCHRPAILADGFWPSRKGGAPHLPYDPRAGARFRLGLPGSTVGRAAPGARAIRRRQAGLRGGGGGRKGRPRPDRCGGSCEHQPRRTPDIDTGNEWLAASPSVSVHVGVFMALDADSGPSGGRLFLVGGGASSLCWLAVARQKAG